MHNPTYDLADSVRPSDRRLTRESLRITASLGFAEFGLTNLARQDREPLKAMSREMCRVTEKAG